MTNFTAGALVRTTSLFINETAGDAAPVGSYLATWDDSDSDTRGSLMLRKASAPGTFATYKVIGPLTHKGNWDSLPVEVVTSSGTFADQDEVTVDFSRTGDKGDTGATGATGDTGTTGATGAMGPGSNDAKESVLASTTANVTVSTALNSGDVVDGVTLASGDRVLVANQTTKSQNGIYTAAASPSRASDADATGELSGGSIVYVEQGTKYGGRQMKITTVGSITPETTAHDWAPQTPKNFGLVETLPTSGAIVGDSCTYIANKTSGVFWQLVYDGEGTSPWKYVGGPPLFSEVAAEQSTESNTYTDLATVGPSITIPLKGDFDIEIGAEFEAGGAQAMYMNYSIAGAAPNEEDRIQGGQPAISGGRYGHARVRRKTALTAASSIVAKYKTSGGKFTATSRWMRITPVRVG
jgi:hypothetical protein